MNDDKLRSVIEENWNNEMYGGPIMEPIVITNDNVIENDIK